MVLGSSMWCLVDGTAGNAEVMSVSTSSLDLGSHQFFWSSAVPSKIPVTSPAAADVLASINTSALASPARARHQEWFT